MFKKSLYFFLKTNVCEKEVSVLKSGIRVGEGCYQIDEPKERIVDKREIKTDLAKDMNISRDTMYKYLRE